MVKLMVLSYRFIVFLLFLILSIYAFVKLKRSPIEFKSVFTKSFTFLFLGVLIRGIDLLQAFVYIPYYEEIHIIGHIIILGGIGYTYVEFMKNLERFFFPEEPIFKGEGAYLARSYEEVLSLIKNKRVLVITRNPTKYRNLASRVIWVTSSGEKGVHPTSLHVILDLCIRFIKENRGGIVLIDCVEFLTLYNGFPSVFKFLTGLKDNVLMRGGKIIIMVNPNAIDKRDLSLLEREFTPLT